MSLNIETVNRYLEGFRKNDHAQILSCLTDDIEWTVFGVFHLIGEEAYDKAIDGARRIRGFLLGEGGQVVLQHRPRCHAGAAHGHW
jgi:hypothetical protein